MPEKIIMDVDTGQDDMVAILMAAALKEIDLLGIVAVAGNQVLANTLANTLDVCQMLNLDIPVYAGMDRPLVRPPVTAGHIHGKTGLDGPLFPPRTKTAHNGHGVSFIVDTVLAYPGQVTLVPTGPLTDIAMAIRLEPRLPELVKRIVLMGGSLGPGNVTPYAEFNIHADPEAASIVFSSGAPVVMIGLDVTRRVVLDKSKVDHYRRLQSRAATMFNAAMTEYIAACKAFGYDWPYMHDPCCIAYLAAPRMFTLATHHIQIELKDDRCYGQTIASPARSDATQVAVAVDQDKFWPLLDRAFATLP